MMTSDDSPALEQRLGYQFSDPELLERAVTHRSYANENARVSYDNEALEFLGDAALELWVRRRLIEGGGSTDAGRLSVAADRLVNRQALAEVASDIGLGADLRLGRGTESQGGRANERLLADSLEAVFGAVFEDGGFDALEDLLERLLGERLRALNLDSDGALDPLEALARVVRERFGSEATVDMLGTVADEPCSDFVAEVRVGEQRLALGRGASKRAARRDAVRIALRGLDVEPPA
jgi:ribonuclease III